MATVGKNTSGNVIEQLAVDDILARAVEYAGKKLGGISEDQVKHLLTSRDRWAHSYFRYAVAVETVQLLKLIEVDLQSAYLLGEHEDYDNPHSVPITILALVERKSPAFEAVSDIVSARLLQSYRTLLGEVADSLDCFVDIQRYSSSDSGVYACLGAALAAVHNPPLCLWKAQ